MKQWKKTIILASAFLTVSAASAYAGSNYSQITAYLNNDIKFTINGSFWTPKDADGNELSALIYNGSSYVPLKSISEVLGAKVNWESSTETIQISTVTATTYNDDSDSYLPYKDSESYGETSTQDTSITGKSTKAAKPIHTYRGINITQSTALLLDVEESTVLEALKQGKTLVQIASDKAGWTEDELLEKLIALETEKIDALVTAGTLDADKATTIKSDLSARLKQAIEKKINVDTTQDSQNKSRHQGQPNHRGF